MWGVFNEFGQIAEFDNLADAEALSNDENAYNPDSHWVLHVSYISAGFPKG